MSATENLGPAVKINEIVSKDQLFVVMKKNGERLFVTAINEDDLLSEIDINEIAFSASLSEMQLIVGDMESIHLTKLKENGDAITLTL